MSVSPPDDAPEGWEAPEWWAEVIEVQITSKAEAKRIARLCRAGEHHEAWEPWFNHFATTEGRIRQQDFDHAQDVLMGIRDPNPGRPGFHDWELIDALIIEIAEEFPGRIVKAEVCRRVAELYRERHGFEINPTSAALKSRVREKVTGL